jgi:hypothetical protein
VKGTHLTVDAILNNAEDFTAEQIATELFEGVTVEQVRRILDFASEHGAMTDTPVYFSCEDELATLLLRMVIEHCGAFSPEKRRAMTSYLAPDPSPDEWLDSYSLPGNADAMIALHEDGLIEITEQDGARIVAKVTPTGRALLERFHTEQERKAAASWRHRPADI